MSNKSDAPATLGQPRPKYEPKKIKCAGCGASQSVKNEHSQLVVCEYCGSHLDVGQAEIKVLGRGADKDWDFPLSLGDDFRHKGQRYEVIARLALIEDGDMLELTRSYLLYNPRRGTIWLSDYKGHYDLSETTHVVPDGMPLTAKRGEVISTHDDRQWVTDGVGEYNLKYVDGALPWIAKIGDRYRYAEFSAKDGSGETFEVEVHADEIEYAVGRKMPRAAVERALGRRDLPPTSGPLVDTVAERTHYRTLLAMAAAMLVVNGLLTMICTAKGRLVLEQKFSPNELSGEVLSNPFEVSADSVVKVSTKSSLNNAWMAISLAVVEGDDKVVHVVEQDIEYYSGVEGGESWSEGKQSKSTYFLVPSAGTHRLLVHAVSARGSNNTAESCQHGLKVRVIDGAVRPGPFLLMTILSGICLLGVAAKYHAWKTADEED